MTEPREYPEHFCARSFSFAPTERYEQLHREQREEELDFEEYYQDD